MKEKIHPKYNEKAVIKCACGAKFNVGSTSDEISVEICSNCHPFYTGKEKLVDTAGRVDKFRARMSAAKKYKETTPTEISHKKDTEIKPKDKTKTKVDIKTIKPTSKEK